MRESSPRAPFDQGLFLTHFNKGKAFYDERRFEDAERELEEAYLLRPRDQRVLNLLGLVYFRQDKLEKAEEVYRKLTVESPEAHTLFYNLGLIYFKLNRLEEAELAFLKALELTRDNPKINFYLGSIYERLHQYQNAIYQYRQAGANLMVRRVEDKIAAGSPARGGALASAAPDDTAEFNARDVREALRPHSARGIQRPADRADAAPDGPPGLPRPREQPHGGGVLGEGLHQAGHDLLLRRQPHVLGQGEAARRPRRARHHHRHRQADPHRQGPADHGHAGGERADPRRARPPARLRGAAQPALRGGRRPRARVPGPRGTRHGGALGHGQAAAPGGPARSAGVGAVQLDRHLERGVDAEGGGRSEPRRGDAAGRRLQLGHPPRGQRAPARRTDALGACPVSAGGHAPRSPSSVLP